MFDATSGETSLECLIREAAQGAMGASLPQFPSRKAAKAWDTLDAERSGEGVRPL